MLDSTELSCSCRRFGESTALIFRVTWSSPKMKAITFFGSPRHRQHSTLDNSILRQKRFKTVPCTSCTVFTAILLGFKYSNVQTFQRNLLHNKFILHSKQYFANCLTLYCSYDLPTANMAPRHKSPKCFSNISVSFSKKK